MGSASVLCVDGGGSGFRKAIIQEGEISNLTSCSEIKNTHDLLNFIKQDFPPNVAGVAYAVAGDIEKHNLVVKSPNLHFLDGLALATVTTGVTGKPTVVCNDMEASVMGMAKLFPFLNCFMGITWSTGIGVRIVKDGQIFSSSEGGHMNIDSSPYATLCGCGLRGCAEAILGGANLQRRIVVEAEKHNIQIPASCKWPSIYLDECFDRGEPWALSLYYLLYEGMARYLANIQNLLHLPAVVWKGMLGQQVLKRVEPDIRSRMRTMLMNPKWEEDMKFYYVWDKEPCKDADSLLGSAEIFDSIVS